MASKWIAGMLGVFVVLGVAGVGFAAFTDTVVVNGTATAATVAIQLTPLPNNVNFPGHTLLTGLSEAKDSVTLTAWNLVPGDYPHETVKIKNVGTVPVQLSVALSGDQNMVLPAGTNGYDVYTSSGLGAYAGTVNTGWVTLFPGHWVLDSIYVGIPSGATAVPASMTFSITYTATAGT
jgi:hypothetical protein